MSDAFPFFLYIRFTTATLKMNKKLLSAALLTLMSIGYSTFASAEPEGSFERFKERVAAIEEVYPEAKKEVVPEIGKNAPIGNGVKHREVEDASNVKNVQNTQSAEQMTKVQKIVNLGISSVRAVAGEDGPILFVADNGRFVIAGRMIDVWQQKELKTLDEIEHAISRVYLDPMGYEQTSYSSMKMGNGEKRTVIFIDPHCGWCHKLINEIQTKTALLKDYTFIVHAVPVLGATSQPYAKKLWCSVAKDEEKIRAMLKGDEAVNALPSKAGCDTDAHDHSIYLSKLIGVKAVPFVIAPDGRVSQGKPNDLRAFLIGDQPSQKKKTTD